MKNFIKNVGFLVIVSSLFMGTVAFAQKSSGTGSAPSTPQASAPANGGLTTSKSLPTNDFNKNNQNQNSQNLKPNPNPIPGNQQGVGSVNGQNPNNPNSQSKDGFQATPPR